MGKEIEILINGLELWNINLSDQQVKQFEDYIHAIIKWNEKINITSIKSNEEIITKHFLDSISSCQFVRYNEQKVIDIGTGVGFPGLPLKIIFPEIDITFVDSSKKKISILKEICNEIRIVTKVFFISENIENVGKKSVHRKQYDIAISRALDKLNVLLEYAIPLLKINGIFVAYKGPNCLLEVENSTNALNKLNSQLIENEQFYLPFSNYQRNIIIVEKKLETDSIYPRRVGITKKRPL